MPWKFPLQETPHFNRKSSCTACGMVLIFSGITHFSNLPLLTYLTSSRPEGRLRPFRTALHPSRSLAAAAAPAHDFQPISSRCLSTLLLHVTRGLPRLLLPSGAQFSAVLAMLLPSHNSKVHYMYLPAPMPWEFHSKKPPISTESQDAPPVVWYWYFLESPICPTISPTWPMYL